MIPTAPCKICNKRILGCHADCKVYKTYREDIERMRKIERQYKAFGGYRCEVFAKQEKY